VAIFIAVVGQWAMYRTRWGVRLRALGEHPRAADTVGISVPRGRYVAVVMSGALGGLAGANLSLEQVGTFTENMTNGRGFIALAANIFGRWTPGGSYLASLLFGAFEALEIKLQLFSDIIKSWAGRSRPRPSANRTRRSSAPAAAAAGVTREVSHA
jgi:ABC-type uncharacterized transport system permease subunit